MTRVSRDYGDFFPVCCSHDAVMAGAVNVTSTRAVLYATRERLRSLVGAIVIGSRCFREDDRDE